ncbi:hypothetical protein SAY86_024022 [Trapa natans]|uniref:Bifunctional inhibitor/plant lipid transfer protein/seed storage helical domain-containing protein n=1 Tax=Trapa natans TaxID=22666 RepID=A0AAN7LVT6_TRANT|nr:hypothetical protein SAY86_024022 [Trapa natans]
MALLCAPIPALVLVVVSVMISASFPVSNGQVMTSCTASMISSFTPCINFVTNSSPNGTAPSPTSECCNSFKSLMGDGMDCMCLIITGNVPFQVPINRSLAVSLPRACKMTGVPIQCKASDVPLPASGPAALGPTPQESPLVPNTETPRLAPEAVPTPLLMPPPPPASTAGSRPVLTPSSAISSSIMSPGLVLVALLGSLFLIH